MNSTEFENSQEFKALTAVQSEWVVTYLGTRDADAATRAAYPRAKNLRRLRQLAQANPAIIAAIELWDGTSLRDSAIAGLQRDIRRSKGVARVQLKRMLFQLQGLIP